VIEHRSLLELSLNKDKSLSCVIEQLVIWDCILVELSLEVQGGQDYFWFLEGTSIIACVLSSSVLYNYPLHKDSELLQTLNLRTVLQNVKEEVSKNTIQPPLLVVFLTFTFFVWFKSLHVIKTLHLIRSINQQLKKRRITECHVDAIIGPWFYKIH